MPFIKKIIDIVVSGTTSQQNINWEVDATDNTTGAPARALQVNGKSLDNTNPLPVLTPAPSSGRSGQTTVATSGTFVILGTGSLIRGVNVRGLFANTGIIRLRYVGNPALSYELGAGDSVWLDANNLNIIELDSTVNNNGVSYIGN